MIKRILISIQIFISFSAFSQSTLPDNFKIGDFLEVYSKDSLRVYFSCTGTIIDKNCASFYRVGKMDTAIINIDGEFRDFDINGNLYFKATMRKNSLEGYASYYFENGKISEEGNFKDNVRTGKWKYYYPSGQLEKVYFYDSGEPMVLEAFKKNGTPTVINGNGKIRTKFRTYMQCSNYETWGKVVNGEKSGKWTFAIGRPLATEIYRDGVFIKGSSSNSVYKDYPKITLINYYPNESLYLVENSLGCPGDRFGFWEYDGIDLESSFYPNLQEKVSEITTKFKNQWLVAGLKIDKDNQLQEINLASSINDIELENRIYNILNKMKKWQTALINAKPIESNIYFSILVDNNQIVILPDYINKIKSSYNGGVTQPW